LKLFNAAYSEKLRISVFPGSLNIALDHVFNWFDARYEAHRIWFGREEYGGERDTLLLPLLERAVARANETERGKLYRNAVYRLLFYTYRPDAVRLLKKVHETLNALEKKRPFHKNDLFQDVWRAYNELIKNRLPKLLPEELERLSRCRSRQRRARQSLFP